MKTTIRRQVFREGFVDFYTEKSEKLVEKYQQINEFKNVFYYTFQKVLL